MNIDETAASPLLQVKNLRTYFYTLEGLVKAVDGVSYDVQRGETVALVGESGCGKSVSALSVTGLIPYPPGRIEDGEIFFDGRDLLKLSREEMRRVRGPGISMIFQEPMTSLNPVFTVERQLTEAMELHLGLSKNEAVERALELLAQVGISDPKGRLRQYPHQFSGGMRQRLMIAMALSCYPKLIIADEPTTSVDVTIQAQILELMKELTEGTQVALILITHNLGIVARFADRVNVMYAGRIIERGTSLQIFHDPSHPYTVGLLHSVPRLDQPRKEKLDPIEGQPPDLADLPSGCPFKERCKFANDKCSAEFPGFVTVDDGHESACYQVEYVRSPA